MNLRKFFNQTAVYWAPVSSDGFGGFTYDDPVEVPVRWAVKQEKFLTQSSGGPGSGLQNTVEEILSIAVILSETDFVVNGRLFLGALIDISSDALPDTNGAQTIKAFEKIPTMKADQFLRKTWVV